MRLYIYLNILYNVIRPYERVSTRAPVGVRVAVTFIACWVSGTYHSCNVNVRKVYVFKTAEECINPEDHVSP